MNIKGDGNLGKRRPKKVWLNCLKENIAKMRVTSDMTDDKDGWKKRSYSTYLFGISKRKWQKYTCWMWNVWNKNINSTLESLVPQVFIEFQSGMVLDYLAITKYWSSVHAYYFIVWLSKMIISLSRFPTLIRIHCRLHANSL